MKLLEHCKQASRYIVLLLTKDESVYLGLEYFLCLGDIHFLDKILMSP